MISWEGFMCGRAAKEPLIARGAGPLGPVSSTILDVRTQLRDSLGALLADREFLSACEKMPDRFERFLEDVKWRRQAMVCAARE